MVADADVRTGCSVDAAAADKADMADKTDDVDKVANIAFVHRDYIAKLRPVK